MGISSKHPGDLRKWLETVIESCETTQQCLTCRKLIGNFRNMIGLEDISELYLYVYPLEDRITHKLQNIRDEKKIEQHQSNHVRIN